MMQPATRITAFDTTTAWTQKWQPRSGAFESEAGKIDILVNNVRGGYERMMEDGAFTWSKPFREQPLWRWDAMFSAGVRASS